MDSNFRRHRAHPRHEKRSTDGFIRAAGSSGPGSSHHSPKRGNTYQPVHRNPRVGNFQSTDGFHPAGRSDRIVGDPQTANPLGRQPVRNASGHIQLDAPRAAARVKKQRWYRRLRGHLFFNPFKRSNWTKKRAMSSFAMIMILVIGIFGGQAWLNARKIFQGGGGAAALQENVDPAQLRGEGDGRVNVLMLGRGGEGHEGADLTDTIMVASINPIQKEAALLSIPRDLYVQTSGGGYTKINAVFANAKNKALANSNQNDNNRVKNAEEAGMKAVEDIVAAKMGIPIHYHAIVDFEGFRKAIDTVGGVDINVPENGVVYERMRIMGVNYALNVQKGWSHFNGLRALAYSRSRYTSARGDFDRSERQRLILVALKNKVISAGTYGNPWKISQLMDNFGDHIRANLSLDEVKRLYDIGQSIDSKNIASVGLADPPNNYLTTSFIDGQSVVVPRAGVDNYKEIQFFIRNRLKDGFLAQENATVAIYNGTAIGGLAGRTADDLKSYGYNISTVADSPTKGAQKTIVVDLTNGQKKYTKRYLENRFGTTAVGSIPYPNINPGNANFVIILGQNEQARLAN
jgi:LCP family protein required for cell wall assembly